MQTIYKYPIQVTDMQILLMPQGALILCVQMQSGVPCIWAMVDPDKDKTEVTLEIYGTGHSVPESDMKSHRRYVGTFQERVFVWHLFEVTNF